VTYDHVVDREPSVRALLALFSDFHLIDLLVRQEFEERGIQPFSLGLLYFIDAARASTPTELAIETGLPPTTLRRWLDELERRGQIKRRPNPADRRSVTVSLTAKGKRAKAGGEPALRGAVAAIEQRLDWKLGEVAQHLEELKDALHQALGYDDGLAPDDRRSFWVDEEPPRRR
jgi:DNA-binding MarR family transcriptional regulator